MRRVCMSMLCVATCLARASWDDLALLDGEDEHLLARETACRVVREPVRVVFNRVPKAGSVTVLTIIMAAARKHAFQIHHYPGAFPRMHTRPLYERWVRERMTDKAPYVYDAHMWFADVSPLPKGSLVWVNLVRDPVRQLTSLFYYQRDCTCRHIKSCAGGALELRHLPSVIPHYCAMSIDQAWARWNSTFSAGMLKYFFGGPGILVDVFCGIRDPVCHTADMRRKYALARAHVASDYLAVGTLERMVESLRLLRHVLPGFLSAIDTDSFAVLRANVGAKRLDPKPSLGTIREMKAALAWDRRLYRFVSRLLDARLRACKISSGAANATGGHAGDRARPRHGGKRRAAGLRDSTGPKANWRALTVQRQS
jgi:hypothetical protein